MFSSRATVFCAIFFTVTKLNFARNIECKEYAKFVPTSYQCPFSSNDQLDVKISHAARQEFPHSAILSQRLANKNSSMMICTGTLISEQFVLVAAHCFRNKNEDTNNYLIELGVTNLADKEHAQDFKVQEIIRHPKYQKGSNYDDIALIKLERKVDINEYVRPACLFTEREIGFDKAINNAWGILNGSWMTDEIMQKVVLELYDEEKCIKMYNTSDSYKKGLANGITYDTMLCAGSTRSYIQQPITGGPLELYHKEEVNVKCMYDIIGVSSFGPRDGRFGNIPDVYIRVSAYIPWIEPIVWS